MNTETAFTANKYRWRLQVRGALNKRQQTELRLALYWLDGLPLDKKEQLVRGEELRVTAVDAVISVLQLAAPHIPLDAEVLESPAPSDMPTDGDDALASLIPLRPRPTAAQPN